MGYGSFETRTVVEVIPHECPFEEVLLSKDFICNNLKEVDGKKVCTVRICPVDRKEFETTTKKVKI